MKPASRLAGIREDDQGSTIIAAAGALLILLAIASIAIDMGRLYVAKNELQNAADAAALAAARRLGAFYDGQKVFQGGSVDITPAKSDVISSAQSAATSNQVAGQLLSSVPNADVVIGKWNSATKQVTPTDTSPDSVQVKVRRDHVANGQIPTFLAGLFGIGSEGVLAEATAGLGGQNTSIAGGLPAPIGISSSVGCGETVLLGTAGSCAAWHDYQGAICGAYPRRSCIAALITSMQNGTFESPDSEVGDTFNFRDGIQHQTLVLSAFESLFNDSAGGGTWTIPVVVYDGPCTPNGSYHILGYTSYTIDKADATGVHGIMDCGHVAAGRSGPPDPASWNWGDIPGLIK
jgi:Flp pilus assembly protein TadG